MLIDLILYLLRGICNEYGTVGYTGAHFGPFSLQSKVARRLKRRPTFYKSKCSWYGTKLLQKLISGDEFRLWAKLTGAVAKLLRPSPTSSGASYTSSKILRHASLFRAILPRNDREVYD